MAKWGNILWWDTSAVITMANAFSLHRNKQGGYEMNTNPKAATFNTGSLPWDTPKVISIEGLLSGAASFNADISAFDTSLVTNMKKVFEGAHEFNGKAVILSYIYQPYSSILATQLEYV